MPKFKSAEFAAQMGADGIVEGYASTFDRTPDSYGDVIAKGAFARTLDEWRAREGDGLSIPLLYGHNTDDPMHNIGRVTDAHEDERGLFVHAEFDADNPTAQYARKLAAEGRLYQFSFAYAIRDAGEVELDDGTKAYELRDLDLYEVSLVQIPANQNAVVTGVKGEPQTIELRPRIEGLTDEQREEVTKAVAEATHNGLEIGLKAGRRNSKADADELRGIRELANRITQAINGLLADEEDADEPDGGPEPDANAEEPDGANAEEPKGTDADELEGAKSLAAAVMAATDAINQ
jgi:HK97 family phage prohead protease